MRTEAERLQSYRQLRTEIRSSDHHLIVGIDIAKEKHYAFFGTAAGQVLCKQFIFPNSKEGFELLLSRTEQLRAQQQLDVVVFGIEPTANYHKPLADYLVRQDQHVVQVSGARPRRQTLRRAPSDCAHPTPVPLVVKECQVTHWVVL
jgi:hypothetical protein